MTMSKSYLSLIAIFLLFFTACKDEEENSENNSPSSANPFGIVENAHTSGQTVNADFVGRITNKNGDPIPGALVSVGNTTTTTDQRGFYSFDDVSVDDSYALLEVEASGMFHQYRALKPRANETNFVDITMIRKIINGFFATSSGGEIEIPGGAKVIFPAGELVTSSGQTFSGEVLVASTYLDPSDPRLMSYMPGSLAAVDEEGEAVGMITYGMIGVELTAAGSQQPLQLADGREATIEMPLTESHLATAPDEIPLWYFDEAAGIWQEEGSASLVGDKYVGTVSHFSFWNCDINVPAVTLQGNLEIVPSGATLSFVNVKLTREDGSSRTAWVDAGGNFQGLIPTDEILTLEVVNLACGEEITIFEGGQIGPFSEDTDLGTLTIDPEGGGVNFIQFEGNVVDCDGNPLQDIVVDLQFSEGIDQPYLYTDENGDWSVAMLCLTEGVMQIDLIDLSSFTENNDYSLSYNMDLNDAYNTGALAFCEGEVIPSFLTYSDDQSTMEYDQVNFAPVADECSPLTASVLGDALNSFVEGLEIEELTSDSVNFWLCNDQEVTLKGFNSDGNYLVVSNSGTFGSEGWLQVNQYYETDDGNLLEGNILIFDLEVEVYEDESEAVLIDTYNPGQNAVINFQVVY